MGDHFYNRDNNFRGQRRGRARGRGSGGQRGGGAYRHEERMQPPVHDRRGDASGRPPNRDAPLAQTRDRDARDHHGNKDDWRIRGAMKNYDNTRLRQDFKTFTVSETKNLLEEMLSDNFQDNIALRLLNPEIQIIRFLRNVDYQDLHVVTLIMRVVIKASENNLMQNNFREFLKLIIDSPFVTKRLDNLISIEMHQSLNIDVLKLLIPFLKLLFEILPGLAYEAIYSRVINLSYMVENCRLKSNDISDDILAEFEELKALSSNSCPYVKNEKPKKVKALASDYLEPPNNFREISIFPTSEDLSIETKDVFLRRNKIAGSYKTVDDYLDVQFRLMREDFIQPLREGLFHLKTDHKKARFDIRLYKSVYVVNSLPVDRMGVIYNIKFDNSHLRRVRWIQSKRFLYGSLLCLSDNNFQTLLFATVANREIRDLENGIITVKFQDSVPLKDTKYTMIETLNMFESYRHVLLKLQETNEKNLCLQKYLVFADENINFPGYLSRNNGLEYTVSNLRFLPGLNNFQWPRAVELELDESQFQAFKTALTKEISIIQGPPGTGKTYLGLKICSCLLQNVQKKLGNFGPILVVCYTNHALDQFLEGISKFTDRIIRIGNRCKSELLQNFSLVNWKRKTNSIETGRRKRSIFGQMRGIKEELIQHQAGLKMAYDSIISLDRLRIFIDDRHQIILKEIGIKKWLNGDSFQAELSQYELQLDNIIEWIIFEEIIGKVNSTVIEAQIEIMNNVENEYLDDNDMEVNFINNNRRLDIDDEDFSHVNAEFQTVVDKMLAISFDDDMLPANTDGFTLVKSKVTKQLFLKRLRSQVKMNQNEANSVRLIINLNINDRWRLYRYWRSRYIESLDIKSKELEHSYENLSKQLNEICFEEDRLAMMDKDIIGMTTTGAARYGRVLAQIQCKIIIVEEAAEVLESHVVASLNPGCEHLILIGDHKQLKPNPAVYELAKTYQLDLSLFERLINNNLHFNTLELQHRMRPEISEIMKFIYPDLKNHPSVLEYPNVPAVSTNIFFFDHSEKESRNDEISSYSNPFEAEFVVSFCRHLMKNGVENSRITVLTLYSGQLFHLRSLMPKQTFEGIRVCVTDNYQGEENDIIILSLVRSNAEDKIGFLSIENRICVCLSRAKMGLYVFGNFQLLSNQNDLWKDICLDLRKRRLLGDTLTLLCQNHPEKRLEVKNPDDFKKYPEGGCEELCKQRLSCGHACRRACHFLDKNHQKVNCMEKCTKLCPNGHRCNLKCWQTCKDCLIKIQKIIPACGHEQLIECYKTPEARMCQNICGRVLPCGHNCLRKCNEKCMGCIEKVMKTVPDCGHKGEYQCSDEILHCNKKCSAILDCEHLCEGTCGNCNAGRLHIACGSKCLKALICGHTCKVKCSIYCPPCNDNCEEGCVHNVCPRKCGDACIQCTEKCRWKCKHQKCTKKCYENCDRDMCNEHCEKMVDCNKCKKRFQCYGVCGEPCRKICLKCDPEVKEIFFGTEENEDAMFITLWTCGHSFECGAMDQYMNTVPDNQEIVPKRCPRCNTVINKRSCFRYLNIVRKIYNDIKHVQSLISKNEENTNYFIFLKRLESRLSKIEGIFISLKLENFFLKLTRESEPLSNHITSKYSKSLDLISRISDVLFRKFNTLDPILDLDYDYVKSSIIKLMKWLHPIRRKFSLFEIDQFYAEFDRINWILQLTITRKKEPFLREIPDFILELKECKGFSKDYSEEFNRKWKRYTTEKSYLPNMAITENERQQIVAAIGLGKGRWFKCKNGHFYVIGECGGANQIAKCPECRSDIGGTNHQLLQDNQLASEMDGAQYAAFSEQANLLNFDVLDLENIH